MQGRQADTGFDLTTGLLDVKTLPSAGIKAAIHRTKPHHTTHQLLVGSWQEA